ncbi:PAS domain-containing sensor histidine kinase [Priestia abyssalis]|uniref:PAS domain-containing sensor histidine kinase n=1 Tax=Priestia abyssalis TaxID=1221450 RepID=UPI000994B9B6|nr:PAS domain-containing sensor histidine kinase [Priestia abyssalis]
MSKKNILLIYIFFSVVWVFLTDDLVLLVRNDIGLLLMWQKIKAIVFIILSSIFIYYLIIKKEEFQTVQEEKEKLHTLINSMVDFVNFKDGEGRWIEANDFGLKLFQLENVAYRGKKDSELAEYTDFYHEALLYCESSDEETWKARKITRTAEVIPLPEGGEKTFDTIKVPLFHKDGSRKGLVVIGRDITERIMIERELSENQQRYQSLVDYNPELVYMVDLHGNLTNMNPQFERITGQPRSAYMGKSILEFVTEKDRQQVIDAFCKVIRTGKAQNNEEVEIIRADGKHIILACTMVPMVIDDQIVGAIGYAKDITQIKETEERLKRTEKLSVVGELAASVAHEIRNPLTSLKGFVQLMEGDDPTRQMYYKVMLEELDRINEIVSEFLMLAKPQKLVFKQSDLVHILKSVMSLLESQANLYGVEMSLEVKQALPHIECEPNQLKQLFINIIKNSIEASSQNVNVVLDIKGSQYVSVKVEDNGCGISEERMKHLGEPFYSSKEKGTGLGLTVSYRILESHRGRIQFESEKYEGTVVEVLLPFNKG